MVYVALEDGRALQEHGRKETPAPMSPPDVEMLGSPVLHPPFGRSETLASLLLKSTQKQTRQNLKIVDRDNRFYPQDGCLELNPETRKY